MKELCGGTGVCLLLCCSFLWVQRYLRHVGRSRVLAEGDSLRVLLLLLVFKAGGQTLSLHTQIHLNTNEQTETAFTSMFWQNPGNADMEAERRLNTARIESTMNYRGDLVPGLM